MSNITQKMEIVEAAKLLRKELRGVFPKTTFSVRVEHYSMGEAINVFWIDGASSIKVDALLHKYEDISRDAMGEILSGCNRFCHGHRRISKEVREMETQEWIRVHGTYDENNINDYSSIWHKICSTDYVDGSGFIVV